MMSLRARPVFCDEFGGSAGLFDQRFETWPFPPEEKGARDVRL
jgi:hypothetical protein